MYSKGKDDQVVSQVLKSCGCLQYEQVLISEGFDRLQSLASLQKDDLVALGISMREGDMIKREADKMLGGTRKK